MSKNTQLFNLATLLRSAGDKGVTRTQIAKSLGIKENSVPVYIHFLKNLYKCEFETVKQGRQIVSYILTNGDEVTVAQHRKGSKVAKGLVKTVSKASKKVVKAKGSQGKGKASKASLAAPEAVSDGSVAVPDNDLHITELTDREFDDIKSQLGI
jgi:predicted ArsR family transcriptional regulator